MVTEEKQENTEDLETTDNELEGLKEENEVLARKLEARDATVAKLEQALAGKDSEVVALRQSLDEAERKLADVSQALAQAVASYKAMVVQSNPGVLTELITGDTVDEVNDSLKSARALVERVRQEVEAETSKTRIPVGAPQRGIMDMSALSPREKIQYTIGGNR